MCKGHNSASPGSTPAPGGPSSSVKRPCTEATNHESHPSKGITSLIDAAGLAVPSKTSVQGMHKHTVGAS